jgi:hypothetical protein
MGKPKATGNDVSLVKPSAHQHRHAACANGLEIGVLQPGANGNPHDRQKEQQRRQRDRNSDFASRRVS